ncbi:hypothetical protein D5086_002902 [Populus alba]|uniref:Uncharacterized protein n=1 Tax=Populus alba TaxID=43335 RepID=A0ACC4D2V2_POPAL
MNHWFLILLSISISISVSGILRFIVNRYFINTKPTVYKLPPSPKSIPVISNLLWLRRISPSNIHSILNSLHAKLGPIITIYLGSRPLIFIADRLLAHKALIQNGAVFANRPPASATQKLVTSNQRNNAAINFLVAEMGWDPEAWEDPLTFKPERFLDHDNGTRQEFDITGSREIKMMPFGAGRRICPGYQLGMLHLEYYVANLVCKFEWRAVDGDDVDLSERTERTMVMKNPLRVRISPR